METWGFESRPQMPGEGFGLLMAPPIVAAAAAPAAGAAAEKAPSLDPNMALGVGGGLLGMLMMTDASKHNAEQARMAIETQARENADARRTEAMYRHDAIVTESNNRLDAVRDQNMTMRFGIMANSNDNRMQMMTMSTVATEALDTRQAIAFKDADIRLAEIRSNERVSMRQAKVDERELDVRAIEATSVGTSGLFS